MSHQPKHCYEFGSYHLNVSERLLSGSGQAISLQPKVFDLLLVLVEHHGHLLGKDELLRTIWPDTIVEEANLANNISILRKTLGENGQPFIETVPKHGYRFVAEVREVIAQDEELAIGGQAAPDNRQPEQIANNPVSSRPALWRTVLTSWHWGALVLGLVSILGIYSWRSTAHPPTIHSLAVLPFKPLVAESRDEAFQFGMADTLITKLSGLQQLIVRPLSAVRKYSSPEQDPLAAGREQQVEAVLDASFQRDGERIKVRARLLNVADGSTLGTYECEEELCANLFMMQDAISMKVVSELSLHLTGVEKARMTKHGTENREAYLLYLNGLLHVNKRTTADAEKGRDYFQQAIQLDPNYALAYAGLAYAYQTLGLQQPHDMIPKAKAAVDKALELDAQLGEAYSVRAMLEDLYEWNRQGAIQSHQRAIELNPNSELAHRLFAISFMVRGRFEEALVQINRALEIEPLSLVANRDKAQILYNSRQYERALEQCQKTIDLDPNANFAYGLLGQAYEMIGEYNQAVTAYLKHAELSQQTPENITALRVAFTEAGWKGFWQKNLALKQEAMKKNSSLDLYQLVEIYAHLGDKESAFALLEKSYAERRSFIYLKIDPWLDSLRSDPRYTDLLRRVNLAP